MGETEAKRAGRSINPTQCLSNSILVMPKRENVKWQNANGCRACKTEFSMFTRKHHCRACGEVFCDDCSSHRMELAGHEEAVRVCERCMKVQSGGKSWASDSSTKKCNH